MKELHRLKSMDRYNQYFNSIVKDVRALQINNKVYQSNCNNIPVCIDIPTQLVNTGYIVNINLDIFKDTVKTKDTIKLPLKNSQDTIPSQNEITL